MKTVEDSRILSPFSSTLTKLDENLQIIQAQIERLRGGLDFNEDQLRRSLVDACHCATILSDLISGQRSNAKTSDQAVIDRLIHELKTLERIQSRRLKLLNLAMELSAGRVRHHRVNRTKALNELRLQAVRELREMATSPSQQKDLPGPKAGKWLHWACGLQEPADIVAMETLRRDFPALEEFIDDMDDRYWVPSESPATEFSSEEAAPEAPSGPVSGPTDGEQVNHDRLVRDLLTIFEKMFDVGRAEAHSRSNEDPLSVAGPVSGLEAIPASDSHSAQAEMLLEARKGDSKSVQTRAFTRNDQPMAPSPGRFQKAHIDKAAARDFIRVVSAWQLDDGQARQLLSVSRAQLRKMRAGEHVTLEPEKLTRISLLFAIYKGLIVLYGTRRGEKWVRRPHSNPLFEGVAPLKYMLKEGVEGLIKVRELVGTWSQ